jgi:hypothetical protein
LRDFRVKYVPGPSFAIGDLDHLRERLLLFFPEGLNWSFEEVSEIERERSGKTRFCISRVKGDSFHVVAAKPRAARTE